MLRLFGASGFAGSHVAERVLAGTNWQVEIAGPDPWPETGRLAEICGTRPDWQERLRGESPESCDYSVVVAGAYQGVSLHDLFDDIGSCRARPSSKVVLVSPGDVYGPCARGRLHAEWDPVIPSSPAAARAACGEAFAVSCWREFSLPLIIVNCAGLTGKRQDPRMPIPRMIRAIRDGEPVHLPGADTYLDAGAAADAVLWLLQNAKAPLPADGAPQPARFNVTGDKVLSGLDLAQMIAGVMGRELADTIPAAPGVDHGLDGSRLWFHGWKAPAEFAESLRETVEWSLRHPEWLPPEPACDPASYAVRYRSCSQPTP